MAGMYVHGDSLLGHDQAGVESDLPLRVTTAKRRLDWSIISVIAQQARTGRITSAPSL